MADLNPNLSKDLSTNLSKDLNADDLRMILEIRRDSLQNRIPLRSVREESVANLLKNLALPANLASLACEVLNKTPKVKLVWLHLAECTGCSESFFRSDKPTLAEFMLNFISLEYHETIMLSNGWIAEECIERLLDSGDEFILAVEGAVTDDEYFSIGGKALRSHELLSECAKKAVAVFAIGTCSCYGGIQAARPNPTKSRAISEILNQKVVQVPGCPPSDINIVSSLAFFVLFKTLPNLTELNRPKVSYGKCLHDMCERKVKFESGIFATNFDDDAAKEGACLFKLGCKGPYAYSNCPKTKFNDKSSWVVQAGHGCIACCEANFWDDFGVYEKPMNNAYAYSDFSILNADLGDAKCYFSDKFSENSIFLRLNTELSLLYQKDNECKNFLNFEFESNPRVILANLAKNKLGASLVENYKAKFPQNHAFIIANYDESPNLSRDLSKFFDYIFVLAKGKNLQNLGEFLSLAQSYKFKHASPFDIKINIDENGAKLDLSKSYRMPLIYLCGGLEIEALAFSAVSLILRQLKPALNFISKRENKPIFIDKIADFKIVVAEFGRL